MMCFLQVTSSMIHAIYNVYIRQKQAKEINSLKEGFYLMMHATHFFYGYMALDHSDSNKRNSTAASVWATVSG